jgi:tRNA(Ile)-lysidine synthase
VRMSRVMAEVDRALEGQGRGVPPRALVVALSGGADSVALLDALVALAPRRGLRLVAAHLDHGLRPESGDDARFCEGLCRRLGVPFRIGHADVRARAERERRGLEDAARRERYLFLHRVLGQEDADAIATAHTRDDQAETLILRLLRGSGRVGLGAMSARRRGIVRPLLTLSRQDVFAHLEARGLSWREDPSNADPRHVRNRVRHELLPYLETRFNPRIKEALARTAGILADEARLMQGHTRRVLARACRTDGDGVVLLRTILVEAPRAVARLTIRAALEAAGGRRGVGAGHIERLLTLACDPASSGRSLALPGGRVAHVRFDEIRVAPRTNPVSAFDYSLPVPGRVELPAGLAVETSPDASGFGDGLRVAVPPDTPLSVRTRRPGDRVLWHGREIALKRFLLDRRIPAEERDGLPLLAAGSRILWFPGAALEARAGDRWIGLRLAPALQAAGTTP